MNVAVVEDEEAVARQLGDYIARYGKEKNISFDVVRFPDGIDFLNGYKPVYDVVLMDIEMPHSNGMRVAHKIKAVAAVGLACGIVTRVFEKRYGLCEILAYWAFVLGIVLMIVCVLGFAGYTVLDLVNSKDVG